MLDQLGVKGVSQDRRAQLAAELRRLLGAPEIVEAWAIGASVTDRLAAVEFLDALTGGPQGPEASGEELDRLKNSLGLLSDAEVKAAHSSRLADEIDFSKVEPAEGYAGLSE